MPNRAYDNLRSMVEGLGGTMEYQRRGYRYGAWIIRLYGTTKVIEATGNRALPPIDSLHVPKHDNPKYWDDYSKDLLPDARQRLMRMMRSTRDDHS